MLKLLVILGLALGLIVGLISKQRVAKTIGLMVVFSILMPFGWSLLNSLWDSLSSIERLLAVLGGSFLVLIVLLTTTTFGREVLASMLGDFFYDGLKRLFRGGRGRR